MADSPASASSLDAIPASALEDAEEEIPSASATPIRMLAVEFSSAVELLDAQMSEQEDSDDELPEFRGEEERNAPLRDPKGQWRTWPLEDHHPTVFDFGRWAWIALYGQGEYIAEQLCILGTYSHRDEWMDEDIAVAHKTMLEHNPMVSNGISIEQWEDLAESKNGEALLWLNALRRDDEENRSSWRYPVENATLGLRNYKIFNVSDAEDRQAAVAWTWEIHRAVLYKVHHPDGPFLFPDPGLFDVGPGGTEDAVWQLRQLRVFDGLRGLKFSRLPGNAMLVDFVREMHAWIDEDDLQVLRTLQGRERIW
jgi:hypothetical protein